MSFGMLNDVRIRAVNSTRSVMVSTATDTSVRNSSAGRTPAIHTFRNMNSGRTSKASHSNRERTASLKPSRARAQIRRPFTFTRSRKNGSQIPSSAKSPAIISSIGRSWPCQTDGSGFTIAPKAGGGNSGGAPLPIMMSASTPP